MRTDTESLFPVISGSFVYILWLSAFQSVMHCLADPAYRQPVLGHHRIGRFMSDHPHKVVYLIDTETTGDTVAVVDEIAVGRERHARRGDFQPAML